jgi:hypothetical protein
MKKIIVLILLIFISTLCLCQLNSDTPLREQGQVRFIWGLRNVMFNHLGIQYALTHASSVEFSFEPIWPIILTSLGGTLNVYFSRRDTMTGMISILYNSYYSRERHDSQPSLSMQDYCITLGFDEYISPVSRYFVRMGILRRNSYSKWKTTTTGVVDFGIVYKLF